MDLEVALRGAVPVFRLKGRLSVNGADDFEKRLLRSIDDGAKQVVFALDDLEYISSAGLRVFYVGIKKLGNRSECFAFTGVKPEVRKIFDVVGLTSAVRLFDTDAEALAAFAAAA